MSFDSPSSSSAATGALLAAAGSARGNAPPPGPSGFRPTPAPAPAAQPAGPAPAGGAGSQPMTGGGSTSGGTIAPSSIVDPTISNSSPASLGQFTYFPVYVINYNNGSVMMPGAYQLGTWDAGVDLRAQVEGTTVSSISWNTSNMPDAVDISGANTYRLTFGWANSTPQPVSVNSVTLNVSDVNSHTETFTFDFVLPAGDGSYSAGRGLHLADLPCSRPRAFPGASDRQPERLGRRDQRLA